MTAALSPSSPRRIPANWPGSRLVLFVACMAYYALLAYEYKAVDSVVYAYVGLEYHPPALVFFLAGALLAAIPLLWMPLELTRPSQVACWWLYVAVLIPVTFVPYHVIDNGPWEVLGMSAMVVCAFWLLVTVAQQKPISLPPIRGMGSLLSVSLCVYVLAMVGVLAILVGFQLTFSLDSVYDRRLEARETLPAGSLLSYGFATLQKSVVPILIAHGITSRNLVWIGVGLSGAVVCFSVVGQKTTFFMPLYLIAVSFLVTRMRHSYGFYQFAGVIVVLLVCLGEATAWGSSTLSAYLSRRLLYAPAQLHAYYYNYFTEHGFSYFAGSLLRWLPTARGAESAGYTIGRAFFNNAEINANGNIWAYGYSEWGLPGMLLTSALLGLILRVIDGVATQGKFMLCCLMAGVMGLSWAEASLTSSLLSAGVVASILILHLLEGTPAPPLVAGRAAPPRPLGLFRGTRAAPFPQPPEVSRHGQSRARHFRA